MKLMSKFLYSLKQGIKGAFHNKTMTIISTISISASLIILGIVLTIVLNINQFIKYAQDEINEVRVSIEEFTNDDARIELKNKIKDINGVKGVEFKTKEASFNDLKRSFGEEAYLLEGVQNPLEDSFLVTIDNPENIKQISREISKLEGVTEITYFQDIIQNFLSISSTVKKFGSILIGGLLLICLVIISNTIKSRVYSKKEEIQIIKYVGGSNLFVVSPFIVEGFFIGLVGATLAIGICLVMYGYIVENLKQFINPINNIMSGAVLPLASISSSLISTLLITGVVIGVLGSVISVKRHLKV
ncbi:MULTISPECIES: permease-like cell division protein FtsX [Romboutsia]|uniref:permease-like cell division protein FtsX n=1 Tax=Romboutsia TaxID=1501226 RepID=UPI000A77E532|nr:MULTISPECIES: permease-like cell division protein FtsX [Romboutsia]MCH1959531.1 permease-like cell division protein FtsX [Romboutsia hominis]MCH1970047.1 permease-like cell division protein FtsX [Romboutsia hominis]MDB8791192.1 permease-like cell division protein FtsX [Romboutsia sp. 1001216sp1]MDB8792303.1 permease-like cell division protein FtsX [Romboutsia sp. 1001216sp1]MDB8795598.1 permease-like cell division protein FtsX [Romboutsia sp. 1001216sp1]